jgi:hypothetical protein
MGSMKFKEFWEILTKWALIEVQLAEEARPDPIVFPPQQPVVPPRPAPVISTAISTQPVPIIKPVSTFPGDDIDSREIRIDRVVKPKFYSATRPIVLSKNFTADEFECPCGMCSGKMNVAFIQKLQQQRDNFGKPMNITSGLRCRSYNKTVGGVLNSRHLYGEAADTAITSSVDRYNFIKCALKIGFNGIGVGRTFIHLDTRPAGFFMWTYEITD